MHISVCVITFRRPRFLKRLLSLLQQQVAEPDFSYSVVVVDNDADQSAKPIVEEVRQDARVEIKYFVEPAKNLALARNKALRNAAGDFAAFIDDDEFPSQEWLRHLVGAIIKYDADGVLGPVDPHFETEPPLWTQRMRLFHRPHYETGYVLSWNETRTGNVLLKTGVIRDEKNLFNPRFGTHGEDMDFFRRLAGEGYKFIWCDEATVYETQPPERMRRRYQLRRALLRGSVSYSHAPRKLPAVLKSGLAVCLYTTALPILQLSGHHNFMNYLIRDCDHIGRLLAWIGYPVEAWMKSI